MNKASFIKAVPVWEKGMQREMNHSLVFTADVPSVSGTLRIAAHTRYQIFIDGSFFAAGPARAGHGFFRIDEYPVSFSAKSTALKIITAGYNSNSYYLTDQPSFLCAEIADGSNVIVSTGTDFTAYRYSERIKKVNRYSFQRPFAEAYDESKADKTEVELEQCESKNFIKRNSPYCEYDKINGKIIAEGKVKKSLIPHKFSDRSLKSIGEKLKGYNEKELESCPVNEAYKFKSILNKADTPSALPENGTALYDMGKITTGFIDISFSTESGGTLYMIINELLPENGTPDPGRDGCANTVKYAFSRGGNHRFISFEPYDYKYIQLIFTDTAATVTDVSQFREAFPSSQLIDVKKMSDEQLQTVYDAAKESFVQNTTDIFMDCPGRERAGWLCDSFFTSRVEYTLTGKSRVEHDFLENFIIPEKFDFLPDGMLPMCYPSDHYDGCFIHNWAMWYVLQLKEYYSRSGDRELIDSAKERVLSLARFTEGYENEKGLLQKLDSWIFVEWSKANDFVHDINYPTNMLYTLFLDAVDSLYVMPEMHEKAEKLRQTIREEAFDGEFFHDNSILDKNGKAVLTDNRTETCQYYAFFSGTATKELYPELFDKMINEFGADRDCKKTYPEIHQSNAFIGNYLRLELLYLHGMYDKLKNEIKSFFLPMAQKTGTLWENMHSGASCNHGFASHVIYWLNNI